MKVIKVLKKMNMASKVKIYCGEMSGLYRVEELIFGCHEVLYKKVKKIGAEGGIIVISAERINKGNQKMPVFKNAIGLDCSQKENIND